MKRLGGRTAKHGLSNHLIYDVWHSMLKRCNNIFDHSYKNYGDRGIKVCDEWHDVQCFYNWAISNGYAKGLSIERKDVNGDYEPDNCIWIPMGEQAMNRRNTHNITIDDITKPMSAWARECGLQPPTLYYRVKRGWAGEDLLKPVLKR
jgi:hypothetical protein